MKKCSISFGQEETSTVSEIENLPDDSHQRKALSKKRRMPLLAERLYFGRKRLFLMSLRLRKKKKRKTRKQHQNSRDKIKRIKIDLRTDSQGASTSETFRTIDVEDSMISSKDLRSTSVMKSKRERVDKFDNDFSQMSDEGIDISCITGAKPGTPTSHGILQNCHASLLKESLRETTGEFIAVSFLHFAV